MVSDIVAELVIDALEAIDIEQDERRILVRLRHLFHKGTAIEEPRQHVGAAQPFECRARDG